MTEVVIGVDLATRGVSFGDTEGRTDSIILDWAAQERPRGFAWAWRQIEIAARQFADGRNITAVWVETPAGRVHPSLWGMYAIVQGAMYTAYERLYRHPVPVFTIVPTDWKECTIGHGHASKDMVQAWCREQGLSFASEHDADALAIARAGESMMSIETREAA